MRNKIALACLVLMFGVGLLWAQSGEPSLAQVAKHKPKKHAAKVVTEDDIPASISLDSDRSAESSRGGEKGEAGYQGNDSKSRPSAKPASSPDDATRLQQLKDQEAQQKQFIKDLKQEMEDETDDFRRDVRRQMLEDTETKLDNTARERQQLEQKMADKKSGEKSTPPASNANPQ